MVSELSLSVKKSLGFVNPNVISMAMFCFFITSHYIRSKPLMFLSFLVFSIGSFYWGSRTYILTMVVFLFLLLVKKQLYRLRFLYVAFMLSFPLLTLIIYFELLPSYISRIDIVSSGRISAFKNLISDFGFGNILFGGFGVGKVDVAYFNMITSFGVVGYYLMISIFLLSLFKIRFFNSEFVMYLYLVSFISMFENVFSPNALVSLLLFSGYFKVLSKNGFFSYKNFSEYEVR